MQCLVAIVCTETPGDLKNQAMLPFTPLTQVNKSLTKLEIEIQFYSLKIPVSVLGVWNVSRGPRHDLEGTRTAKEK